MSFSETVFLFILALVVFGPKKLPEIARQLGKIMSEFRRASNEFKAQIEQEVAHLEVEDRKRTMLPPTAPPEGTAGRKPGLASGELATLPAPATPAESPSSNANGSAVISAEATPPAVAGVAESMTVADVRSAGSPADTTQNSSSQEVPQQSRQESHA